MLAVHKIFFDIKPKQGKIYYGTQRIGQGQHQHFGPGNIGYFQKRFDKIQEKRIVLEEIQKQNRKKNDGTRRNQIDDQRTASVTPRIIRPSEKRD